MYVQQEWVNASFLASSKVGSPDPRQDHPPQGQRLVIAWDLPRSLFERELTWVATIRLWNHSECVFRGDVSRRRDATAVFIPANNDPNLWILTYRVQLVDISGAVVETWEHHFWTEAIFPSLPSACKIKSSVSDQPKQESVIETP